MIAFYNGSPSDQGTSDSMAGRGKEECREDMDQGKELVEENMISMVSYIIECLLSYSKRIVMIPIILHVCM